MISKGLAGFLMALLIAVSASAQDKILLLSGKTIDAKVLKVSEANVEYIATGKKKKKKTILENYRVFSVTKSGEKENVLYKQDTLIGNHFKLEEMRMFINGEKDALNNYNAKWALAAGAVFSYGVFLYDTYGTLDSKTGFFRESPSVLNLAAPVVFTIVAGLPKIKIDINKVSNRAYLADQHYIMGYERVARSKKVINALKGSVGGMLLGFASYAILKP